ncbi:glutamate/tyrosine decarboxylase-like PLP-dependent enzyme [Lewinella marina]|uniref:Amino acid decarboxylase n=1 Tax=Neolewinella marina TaxID=438751 RepID=A0A2G0CDT9_9BACT|nr:aminotransferase class V-fold PLP-dependent enzyme [Neolewinella marina]NJB85939.1 glutamate/tyrosine decarboxylase-like PLP-dependent enzyme [Neolewinella marina]PHK98087.1 amino acid decarboxylase [Neolewinella marina]
MTPLPTEYDFDPADWPAATALGQRMLADMMNYLEGVGDEVSWQQIPDAVKERMRAPLPQTGQPLGDIYAEFIRDVVPYNKKNIHPAFYAWVQGTGTVTGLLADMLASALNPNVTIGEHMPMYVDAQAVDWCKELMGFPASASGMLVSGGSMANITALTVARNSQLGPDFREEGFAVDMPRTTVYCSTETHSCVQKAVEILGIGNRYLRRVPVNDRYEMDHEALIQAIEEDIAAGHRPICVVATAGTVNTGAIDPMEEIFNVCQRFGLWFHVDGAYGALCRLDPTYRERLRYMERADSIAFDLHKWMYLPYEVGCVLIRDRDLHRRSFALTPSYLQSSHRGLAGGPDPLNNYGFELSRNFKALKVWMSLKENGVEGYARLIAQNNRQAEYVSRLAAATDCLEVVAPVSMSIVCLRYIRPGMTEEESNALNRELLLRLHERGIASPSATVLRGMYCIRICIVNHKTKNRDLLRLVEALAGIGNELYGSV